ncbi:hypothetical protein [Clostridium chauvoei]|uniref:Lipoprotein n=2 Tax=Clostridium chauvoei TaxID=46867 RepID=S6EXJ0_9CLOT|nr:hypothetical protein [Clostridium chauvoei]ATD54341.1 hypothetical protein BTM20_03465 [Clostridium chauvoei]ATD57975.1 hypothetical protein BTM21_09595 [Clostridium chauvoei]MBX7279770.1 hypothetical protein [Clostridium chauvoei]MBX7282139.1 hypothetical protein [Clostridium chauvoei]MBX7284661.1 hypothetical protein [Clostridium chauvoei]
MRKNIKIITLISIITTTVVSLLGCFDSFKEEMGYASIVNSNWDIVLPCDYEEIYSFNSKSKFWSYGKKYHIFEYRNIDKLYSILDWKDGENQELEDKIIETLKDLGISKEYFPKFNSKYKYYIKENMDSSKLYVVFIPYCKILIIMENLI